jgi:hypothetical protein
MKSTLGQQPVHFNALEKSPVCMALISFSPTCGKPSLCFHFRVLSWQHHQTSTNNIVYEIPWKMHNNTLKDTIVTGVSSTKPKTNTIRMNGFITMYVSMARHQTITFIMNISDELMQLPTNFITSVKKNIPSAGTAENSFHSANLGISTLKELFALPLFLSTFLFSCIPHREQMND